MGVEITQHHEIPKWMPEQNIRMRCGKWKIDWSGWREKGQEEKGKWINGIERTRSHECIVGC